MIGTRDYTVGDITEESSIKNRLNRYEERDINPFSLLGQREETTLAQTCIRLLADRFEEEPISSERLPPDQYKLLCDEIRSDIDPTVAVAYIQSEDFWKVFLFSSLSLSLFVCLFVSFFLSLKKNQEGLF